MASPQSSGMASGPGPACQACSRGRRHLPQSACLGLQCHPRNSPALRPTAQIGLQPPCPDGAPGRVAGASPSALPPPAPPLHGPPSPGSIPPLPPTAYLYRKGATVAVTGWPCVWAEPKLTAPRAGRGLCTGLQDGEGERPGPGLGTAPVRAP